MGDGKPVQKTLSTIFTRLSEIFVYNQLCLGLETLLEHKLKFRDLEDGLEVHTSQARDRKL